MQKLENPESWMFQQDQTVILLKTMQCHNPDIYYFNANFQCVTSVEQFISPRANYNHQPPYVSFSAIKFKYMLVPGKEMSLCIPDQSEACFKDSVEKKMGDYPQNPTSQLKGQFSL